MRIASARLIFLVAMLLMQFSATSARAQPAIGEKIRPLEIELLDGRVLAPAATQGKVLIVVFWATWCPICMHELPEMQRLVKAYRKKGVEILALSLDEDADVVAAYWKKSRFDFPVAMRSDEARDAFGPVRGTPTTVILDRSRTLRARHIGAMGYEALEQAVTPLL